MEAVIGIRDAGKLKSLRNANSLHSAPIGSGLYGADSGCLFKFLSFGGRRIARDHLGNVCVLKNYTSPDRLGTSHPSGAAAFPMPAGGTVVEYVVYTSICNSRSDAGDGYLLL